MKNILIDGFAQLSLNVSDEQIDKLCRYAELLKLWNEKMNLTAICDDFGIATKHFLDSSTALLTNKVSGKVIDVGTGAGFPGLVLKILMPQIELTLLDSLAKRLTFLDAVAKELNIDIKLVHARAEDGARQYREQFDTVVSRAVANMSVLSEYCLPFLKQGGNFLALKGPQVEEELQNAKRAIYVLGGDNAEVFTANIPQTDLNHKIVIIKKVRHTPQQYPRKAGIVTKSPIENCYNLKKKPTK